MEFVLGSVSPHSEIRQEVITSATTPHVVNGTHPVKIIRNVNWENAALYRRARNCGFLRLTILLELKQHNIKSVEMKESELNTSSLTQFSAKTASSYQTSSPPSPALPSSTARPSFCFVWVEDLADIEIHQEILEGWGFRVVEDVVIYDASLAFNGRAAIKQDHCCKKKRLRRRTQRCPDCDETRFGNLTRAEVLSDPGLDQAYHDIHDATSALLDGL